MIEEVVDEDAGLRAIGCNRLGHVEGVAAGEDVVVNGVVSVGGVAILNTAAAAHEDGVVEMSAD